MNFLMIMACLGLFSLSLTASAESIRSSRDLFPDHMYRDVDHANDMKYVELGNHPSEANLQVQIRELNEKIERTRYNQEYFGKELIHFNCRLGALENRIGKPAPSIIDGPGGIFLREGDKVTLISEKKESQTSDLVKKIEENAGTTNKTSSEDHQEKAAIAAAAAGQHLKKSAQLLQEGAEKAAKVEKVELEDFKQIEKPKLDNNEPEYAPSLKTSAPELVEGNEAIREQAMKRGFSF